MAHSTENIAYVAIIALLTKFINSPSTDILVLGEFHCIDQLYREQSVTCFTTANAHVPHFFRDTMKYIQERRIIYMFRTDRKTCQKTVEKFVLLLYNSDINL